MSRGDLGTVGETPTLLFVLEGVLPMEQVTPVEQVEVIGFGVLEELLAEDVDEDGCRFSDWVEVVIAEVKC